jgi:hypothetical protein
VHLLEQALWIGDDAIATPALVREIISVENKDSYLKKRERP